MSRFSGVIVAMFALALTAMAPVAASARGGGGGGGGHFGGGGGAHFAGGGGHFGGGGGAHFSAARVGVGGAHFSGVVGGGVRLSAHGTAGTAARDMASHAMAARSSRPWAGVSLLAVRREVGDTDPIMGITTGGMPALALPPYLQALISVPVPTTTIALITATAPITGRHSAVPTDPVCGLASL